jgi:outer membrane protein OmpA-like peptidoglycan-associated protein
MAVSDAQQGVFRPGAMPAVGLYAANQRIALGVRMRAGVLRNGPAPGDNFIDPGAGGLATGGVAMRFLVGGAWAEVVLGGGLTGSDVVPVAELGVGWGMDVGRFNIGPSVRYAHVYARDTMDTLGSAGIVLVGVDVKVHRERPHHSIAYVARAPRVEPAAPVVIAPDHDVAVDHEQSCAEKLDGCPIADSIVIRDYRIILEERVLFDFDKSRVRHHGKELIAQIAKAWKSHPEWQHVTIEGHADDRGTDAYNEKLSETRAAHVRDVLVKLGFSEDDIDVKGYGRSQPRDQGRSEDARARNRRVEFVIDAEMATHAHPIDDSPADVGGAQ